MARNDGAARASGTWLAFLDSDDRWREDKIAQQLHFAAQHPAAPAIFCGIRYAYAERKPRIGLPPPMVGSRDLAVSNVLATTSTALVRKDKFDAVSGFDVDLPTCEDWDLWLKLSKLGPLPVVQAPLVEYTYEAANKLSRDVTKLMMGHELVFARISAENGTEGRGRLSALHDLKRAELHIRVTGEALKALSFIWSALSHSRSAEVLRRAAHLMGLMTAHGARL